MNPNPDFNQRGHRLVITGATGTLGRNLIAEVLGWNQVVVLALVRANSKPSSPKPPNVIIQEVDYSDRAQIDAVLKQFNPTCVIHCAASGMQFHKPAWFEMVRFNVDVSLNLCEGVSRVPGCQFIYISTGLAYRDQGRPLREEDALDTQHPYGASKAAADILIRSAAAEFGVPLTIIRPFSFSGLGDASSRLFPSLLRAAVAGQPFHMTSGDQIRDHCAVADIAHGVCLAIQQGAKVGAGCRIFNLGSGNLTPLRTLVNTVVDELGLGIELRFGNRPLSQFEPKHLVADYARANTELGWHPRVNFSYAVWQLAQESFPTLILKQPKQWL